MITVKVEETGITVTGHANFAPKGQDIVCAAVSALYTTLYNSMNSLTDDAVEAFEIGDIRQIKYTDLSEKSKTLIDAFFIGINGISEEYPDYIQIL